MFQLNDCIICGGNGVCKVVKIGPADIGGMDNNKLYYTLEPVYSKKTVIYTPVDNCKVVMRKILCNEEALSLLHRIKEIEVLKADNEKQLEAIFKGIVGKYDCGEWFRIVKTLYLKRNERIMEGKRITATDMKYLRIAEENAFGELATALMVPKEKIAEYVQTELGHEAVIG